MYDEDMLPEPDIEYRIAHALLGSKNGLDRAIVGALAGHPKRYSQFKPLLKGKADNNLTMALDRLQRDGVISQSIDARKRPVVKSYELTNLGVLVLLRMHEMIPAHESARILLRGRRAAEG